MGMVAAGDALCVPGNHENKLLRALRGPQRAGRPTAWRESLAQLGAQPPEFRAEVEAFIDGLLIALRARRRPAGGVRTPGCPSGIHGRASGRVRAVLPVRRDDRRDRRVRPAGALPVGERLPRRAMVLYGHTPVPGAGVGEQHHCASTPAACSAAR